MKQIKPATPLPWDNEAIRRGREFPTKAHAAFVAALTEQRDTLKAQNARLMAEREQLVAALRGTLELIYSAGDLQDSPQYATASALLARIEAE